MPIARRKHPKLTGEAMRAWRKSVGLTQAQLAGELGITPACWSQWEHGTRQPPYYLALALNWIERRVRAGSGPRS